MTFKAVTAIAGLQSKLITPDTYLESGKDVELFGTTFKNYQGQEQGDLKLVSAIKVSSDTYFYRVGAMFVSDKIDSKIRASGHTHLYRWAKNFGFGTRTGIDLPGEAAGVVPDRLWKTQNISPNNPFEGTYWNRWRRGDTINMSVGQGYMKATPLQMARQYASLVNGGKLVTPHIAQEVADPTNGKMTADLSVGQQTAEVPPIDPKNLDAVKEGLYDVANKWDGTAASVFGGFGGLVAGKTGTAESDDPDHDHAWFVGYGPTDNPKYVVVAFVEHSTGTGGSVAAPIACRAIAAAVDGVDPETCGDGSGSKGLD